MSIERMTNPAAQPAQEKKAGIITARTHDRAPDAWLSEAPIPTAVAIAPGVRLSGWRLCVRPATNRTKRRDPLPTRRYQRFGSQSMQLHDGSTHQEHQECRAQAQPQMPKATTALPRPRPAAPTSRQSDVTAGGVVTSLALVDMAQAQSTAGGRHRRHAHRKIRRCVLRPRYGRPRPCGLGHRVLHFPGSG